MYYPHDINAQLKHESMETERLDVSLLYDTHMEELVLCWIQHKIHWNTRLAASDMFTHAIKFFWYHYRTDVLITCSSKRE